MSWAQGTIFVPTKELCSGRRIRLLTEQAAASGYKYRQRCDSTGNATKSKNHCTNIKESLFKMSSQLEGEILNVSDDESAPAVGLEPTD